MGLLHLPGQAQEQPFAGGGRHELHTERGARWASHNVHQHRAGAKALHHPVVGRLDLDFEAMEPAADSGLTLMAYSAEPGSASQEALDLLASWALTLEQEQAVSTSAAGEVGPAAEQPRTESSACVPPDAE